MTELQKCKNKVTSHLILYYIKLVPSVIFWNPGESIVLENKHPAYEADIILYIIIYVRNNIFELPILVPGSILFFPLPLSIIFRPDLYLHQGSDMLLKLGARNHFISRHV